MILNEKFRFDLETQQDQTRVYLHGVIDEDTDFEPLRNTESKLIINFRGVTSINSCGIRTWVNFIKELEGKEIWYEECPPLIVRQMNMVPSFLGSAKVASVFVPYVCDACDAEKLVLVAREYFSGSEPKIADAMQCDQCQDGEMELDGHPKQYFAFSK